MQVYPVCAWGVNLCNSLQFDIVCELALVICQNIVVGPIQAAGGNFNVYDIRKPCIGQLCYDFSRLDDYLAQPDVRKALGVDDRAGTWQSCNQDVYNDFLGEPREASCPETLRRSVMVVVQSMCACQSVEERHECLSPR